MNLKHKKNFELRFKVLLEVISPAQLCEMSEDVGCFSCQELAPPSLKIIRQQELEKAIVTKPPADKMKFISESMKHDMMIGSYEEDNLPPQAVDEVFDSSKDKSLQVIPGIEAQDKEDLISGFGSKAKIDKEMKDLLEDLNPEKLTERAEHRINTYLPHDTATVLSTSLKRS